MTARPRVAEKQLARAVANNCGVTIDTPAGSVHGMLVGMDTYSYIVLSSEDDCIHVVHKAGANVTIESPLKDAEVLALQEAFKSHLIKTNLLPTPKDDV